MSNIPTRAIIHVDGGARGNPGPAAAGVVIRDANDRQIIWARGIFLGETTNNVAEYRGLLEALRTATQLRLPAVSVFSDSELMVRQMTGQYRVRQPHLKKLHQEATELAGAFEEFAIEHVRWDKNLDADKLVNQALNLKQDVDGADL